MTDISKFKSIAVDIDTYNKLELICKEERRNKRQQIGLMVDKECEKQGIIDNVKTLGLGTLDRSHS